VADRTSRSVGPFANFFEVEAKKLDLRRGRLDARQAAARPGTRRSVAVLAEPGRLVRLDGVPEARFA
jgi:hypothetical protein